MGIFDSLFGKSDYKNPADASMGYLNQIGPLLQQHYGPYAQMGQQLTPQLQQQFQSMMQNPGALMQQIGAGYKQSPGFQNQMNQGMTAANNAAAAGGMLGSGQHQQQSAGIAENLANQDFNQYMQNAMGVFGGGLQGLSGLQKQGFGAGTGLADNLVAALMSQANMKYAGQANQNNMQQQDRAGNMGLFGNLAGLLPMLFM